MKIALVGYEKPDMESVIQAYALKKYLETYGHSSYYFKKYKVSGKDSKELITKTSFADRILKRKYMESSAAKLAESLNQFLSDNIGFDPDPKEKTDNVVMVNYRACVSMDKPEAFYLDFYQRDADKKNPVLDTVLLLEAKEWEKLFSKEKTKEAYLLLDCESEKSALIPFAQKMGAAKKLKVVSPVAARKYSDFEKTEENYDPAGYIKRIYDAEFVVTDCFTTAYFAILFKKPLAAGERMTLPNRNKRLLTKLNLSKNYFGKTEPALTQDFSTTGEEVEEKRQHLVTAAKNYAADKLGLSHLDEKVDCPTDILKSECCGCYACKEVCPVNAIEMRQDKEGFYYPHVNDACIHCNLCYKACVKNENHQTIEFKEGYPKAYSANNKDEAIRFKSSSGGVFPSLVENIIGKKQGVVFGVRWDEQMNAVSDLAVTMDAAKAFYGSKYVKSELDGVYKRVKEQLTQGKYVLYSGLPCECAALKAYLRKDYEKLVICEILCHAAPSPSVFKEYLKYIEKKFGSKVKNVTFREKSKGWLIHQASLVFEFQEREPVIVNARRNNYFRNFLVDNISRPGCADCSFTARNRVGDLTIGDFWGINRLDEDMFDNKGTSVVFVNTEKGEKLWKEISEGFKFKEMKVSQAFKFNHSKPMPLKKERNALFRRFKEEPVNDLLQEFNDLKQK